MDRIKPRDLELTQLLGRFNKLDWSVADLEKVLRFRDRRSLLVALHRLARSGVLERVRRGIYRLPLRPSDLPRIANLLYFPSYLSFESALSKYGVLSQIPYMITFATSRRTKTMNIGSAAVEFHQLRKDLFFGWRLENGLMIAEPEKALLDALYIGRWGRTLLAVDELRLDGLSREKLLHYVKRFPGYVQKAVKEMKI